MNTYEEFDKRFEFLLKAGMQSFLVVKIALTADYGHVKKVLLENTEAGIIFLLDKMNILETVSSLPQMCVLIHVNPDTNTLFYRLNYIRDALKLLNKMLIFVFYEFQYNKAIYEYPDFFAYTGTCLECKSRAPLPFTQIFSCNVLDYQTFVKYPSEIRNLRAHRIGNSNDLIDIQKSIQKLRYTRVSEIDLEKLDRQITMLCKNAYLTDSHELVIDTIIDYIETLVAKEKFRLARTNILDLYIFIVHVEFGISLTCEPDISTVMYFCRIVASDDRNIYSRSIRVWVNKIIKILIPYLLNDFEKVDLSQIAELNSIRINLIKNIPGCDNELAQYLNDFALLLDLLKPNTRYYLEYFDSVEGLNVNYVNMFLYHYNKAVLLLRNEQYEEAQSVCDKFLLKSAEINYSENNLQEVKISLIKNWISGVYGRKINQAIEYNTAVLKRHREVFSENHYSLAEIHYCNAFLYRESNNFKKSMGCLKKAHNILKNNHSVRLEGLRELIADFDNA